MAIQFAFYRIHQTPGAHYESGSTRMFNQGRTEVIRSCSNESIQFAKTMLKPDADKGLKVNFVLKYKNFNTQSSIVQIYV
jgi:carnitine O-acetyltransferase